MRLFCILYIFNLCIGGGGRKFGEETIFFFKKRGLENCVSFISVSNLFTYKIVF